MIIETLGELNTINAGCGCCPMPTAPAPVKECQYKSGASGGVGWNLWNVQDFLGQAVDESFEIYDEVTMDIPCPDRLKIYKTVSRGVTSSDPESSIYPTFATINIGSPAYYSALNNPQPQTLEGGDDIFEGAEIAIDAYSGGVFTGSFTAFDETVYTVTLTFSNPVTLADMIASAEYVISEYEWTAGTCIAKTETAATATACGAANATDYPETVTITRVRYRWQIPAGHTGLYFKITWDVLTDPLVGDSTLETDLTWEWAGPGTGPADDPSRVSGWYDLPPPSVPGERRIVNIRYQGYRSARFGSPTQTTGEGYTPP